MQPSFQTPPMLAKSVPAVPEGEYAYEPKWDGFRAIVERDADGARIGSRGGKELTRYFPELVAELAGQLPAGCVVDGEIVVRTGGGARLDWEALSQRIHPAASRVTTLAARTPASFVAFDVLQVGGVSLLDEPYTVRATALDALLTDAVAPVHRSPTTTDAALAADWFSRFEGAGLDGVIAKPLDAPYEPGKRTMRKVKHDRTADAVVVGYRVHKSGSGVGSLLLGLHDAEGELRGVGGASAFTMARRQELVDELEPLVERDERGEPAHAERERNRFSTARDTSFVPLRPERVVEVRYDQMEGQRFRHAVQFVRWRPDRDPASCTFEQLEQAPAYDVGDVLAGRER